MTDEELDSLQTKCDASTDWEPGELSRTLAGVYQEPKIWHLATEDFYNAAYREVPRMIAELRVERRRRVQLQLELEEWERVGEQAITELTALRDLLKGGTKQ